MADKTISQLPAATTLYDNDLLVLEQSGSAKKMAGTVLKNYIVGVGGIDSIALNSNYTLTINYTNGTSYTTGSIRGERGLQGYSISRIELTGSSGLTKTYTVYSTNNDAVVGTFSVVDGTDVSRIAKTSGTGAAGTSDTYTVYDTNNHSLGTFNVYNGQDGVGSPGNALPLMDGIAAVGTANAYARQDHVHPSDQRMFGAFSTNSASGASVTVTDGADGVPVKSLTVQIEPRQAGSGTPSPSNVRPIAGWTAATVGRAQGNNLMGNVELGLYNANTGAASSSTTRYRTTKIAVDFTAHPTYRVYGLPRIGAYFLAWDGDGNFVARTESAVQPSSVVLTKDSFTNIGTTGTGAVNTIAQIAWSFQSLTGSEDMAFAASANMAVYADGGATVVSFGEAGTVYGGTLDVANGLLTVDRVGMTFDGSESWTQIASGSNNPNGSAFRCNAPYTLKNFADASGFADLYATSNMLAKATGALSFSTGASNTFWWAYSGTTVSVIYGEPQNGTTLAQFKAFLGSNPLTICGEMETPITYQLTPGEVTTLLTATIWCDTGDITEMTYRVAPSAYVAEQIAAAIGAAIGGAY